VNRIAGLFRDLVEVKPMTRILLLVLLLAAGAPQAGIAQADTAEGIAVMATPIPLNPRDPSQTAVGRLRYMGGLHLTSPDERFGGLSGLRWHAGKLYAVSDQGDFFRLTLQERDRRLTGVGEVRIRRLTRPDGRPLEHKGESDAEALDIFIDYQGCRQGATCSLDSAAVAFEGSNALWMYTLVDGLPEGAARELTWGSRWRRGLPRNGGVEAMAAGYLLSETLRERDGRASGLVSSLISESTCGTHNLCPWPTVWRETEAPMHLPVADGFAPTDAVKPIIMVGSPTLVLQRRYHWRRGAAARIVWFRESDETRLDVREVVGLETLAELAAPLNVDNMEGLAYSNEGGDFLYLISDDNFSRSQRTLLLKFELTACPAAGHDGLSPAGRGRGTAPASCPRN
jgi:hypothetical protein